MFGGYAGNITWLFTMEKYIYLRLMNRSNRRRHGLVVAAAVLAPNRAELLPSSVMPTDHIVALLIAERDKLNDAIEALGGTAKAAAPKKPAAIETSVAAPAAPKKKRTVSAAARKRMAEGQKKRWAAIKGAK
jgi:hypothetical protein